MSEDESAKAKPEPAPARSPTPPLARPAPVATPAAPAATPLSPVKVRPPLGAALGASPFRAASSSGAGGGSAVSASPPSPAKGAPIAPRPPVASVPDSPASEPTAGSGEVTAITTALPRSALDSQVADLVAWRREAEKKIAHLEADLLQLRRSSAASFTPPFASAPTVPLGIAPSTPLTRPVDLQRDPTGPLFPDVDRGEASITSGARATTSVPAARATMPPEFDASMIRTSLVTSIAPREARKQYELDLRPGEFIDMPSELDGGKRKRMLAGLAFFVMLAGMAALVITALASQR